MTVHAAASEKKKMNINIKDFLKECRTRGLTDHTTETYKSNVTCFLDFIGDSPYSMKVLGNNREINTANNI